MTKDGSNDMYYNCIRESEEKVIYYNCIRESEEKVMEDEPCREIVTKEVLYRRLEDAIREEEMCIMAATARRSVLQNAKWSLDEYFADEELRNQTKKDDSKETLKALVDIQNHCNKTTDCSVCPYCTCDNNKSYNCCLYGIPSDWRDLDEVIKNGKNGI